MKELLYLVVGLGKTGQSIARYLRRRNLPFIIYDTRTKPEGTEEFYSEFPGVDIFLGEFPFSLYPQLRGLICSPGVPLDSLFIKKAEANGIPIIGDIECLVKETSAPIIAITGTNGKSTVTTLVGEMIKASGKNVAVAGNIGLPVLDMLDIGVAYDYWVLELSSFQLDLTHSLAPLASTVLNITPDHLDRHCTMEAYTQAKYRVYQKAQTILFNRQDPLTLPPQVDQQTIISFGIDTPKHGQWGLVKNEDQTFLAFGEQIIMSVNDMRIKGQHNWLNALAACALAHTANVSFVTMAEVLQRFGGLPHRSQWVRKLNDVDWVNDSKGTNVGATRSSIAGIGATGKCKIVLIAGGQGKGANFSDLREPVSKFVRSLVLIGEDAKKIENDLDQVVPVLHAPSLAIAVQMAKNEAKAGDVVLLSPACSSFDMFRDFNHRGDEFIAAVNALES
jgi:UDP-N-acetylmuramoylalanine--D-glutamate ligase